MKISSYDMFVKEGTITYDYINNRVDILFDNGDRYGGLHCGKCLEILVNDEWVETRIENDGTQAGQSSWYFEGFSEKDFNWYIGLRARL